MNSENPLVLLSESTNDAPLPKVSSWFLGDFSTGQILSDAIDCGNKSDCIVNGCRPTSSLVSSSPSHSPISIPLPTSGPTIEPITDQCVTVVIECDTS